ncbi:universal stress protein [Nitrincola sp.]|uniref:universal stress protein n=1 Tax=Nitrincola sp. TaxID=1926584 RepID=UPI003A92B381
MTKISKLLVNLTTDENTEGLLEKAVRIGQSTGAGIELFKCGYQSYPSSMSMVGPAILENLQHQQLRMMEEELDQIAASFRRLQPGITTDVAWARDISDGVLTKAARYQPDLLLHEVAEHPHLLHRILVPQDWELLREAKVPLLLCKERPWPDRMRLVAAIDPFHLHDKAAVMDHEILAQARLLAESLGAELHILHTYASVPQSAIFDDTVIGDFESMQVRVKEEHEARLVQVVKEFDPEFDLSLLHVIEGEIHQKLPEFVRNQGMNLVVMGSLARGMLDRLLLGSSVERVLDVVPCDVLVLKPDAAQ